MSANNRAVVGRADDCFKYYNIKTSCCWNHLPVRILHDWDVDALRRGHHVTCSLTLCRKQTGRSRRRRRRRRSSRRLLSFTASDAASCHYDGPLSVPVALLALFSLFFICFLSLFHHQKTICDWLERTSWPHIAKAQQQQQQKRGGRSEWQEMERAKGYRRQVG